jgi:hypothetical protein
MTGRSRGIWTAAGSFLLACGLGVGALGGEHPSATELLDRYAANRDKIGSSITYKCEESGVGRGKAWNNRSQVQCDGNRIRVLVHREPERVLEKRDGVWCAGEFCRVERGGYRSELWEDDRCLRYHKVVGGEPRGRASITGGEKAAHCSGYKSICCDAILWGFLGGRERIDAFVRKGRELSVRERLGKVEESRCYIIDAVTEYGKYVLWLDPERGYNIVKAQFLQREGDLKWNNEPVSKGAYGHWSMRNVHLEKIDGLWIPVEADSEHTVTGSDPYRREMHVKRTEVKLNPEFGADAFAANDIADWAPVELLGSYAIEGRPWYYWHEGQVVDYQGRVVEYKVKRAEEPILVGKALPGWETLGLDIDESELEGKRVLVCICDMNETLDMSSWYLVVDLVDRYEKLKQKGIIIVVVQVPKLPPGTLKEWEKKYGTMPWPLPFTVNMADEAVVRARREWGVRRLPWLILTNQEHVVVAERFSLAEVDEVIK